MYQIKEEKRNIFEIKTMSDEAFNKFLQWTQRARTSGTNVRKINNNYFCICLNQRNNRFIASRKLSTLVPSKIPECLRTLN